MTIHPTAVLAPGVILQAAGNSKIIIGAGVCIGMGSILQVSEGTLEVDAGANLGAGFLMVGNGKIGANACVGSATTVFNCSIEPGLVIPPGSVLGDTSRIEEATPLESSTSGDGVEMTTEQGASEESSLPADEETVTDASNVSASASQSVPASESQSSPVAEDKKDTKFTAEKIVPSNDSLHNIGSQIYGQVSISKLLVTLFPHRQSLSEPISDDQSE